jgi:hypothetical protein
MKQPAAIFADDTQFHKYITPKGNISFQTKTNFWKQTYTP